MLTPRSLSCLYPHNGTLGCQPCPRFQSFSEKGHFILPSQTALHSDIQLIPVDSPSNPVDEGGAGAI